MDRCKAGVLTVYIQHTPQHTQSKYEALGPDPLREDANKERLWAKMQATAKPIGQVLMDQSCVAGIGNIYRAEM